MIECEWKQKFMNNWNGCFTILGFEFYASISHSLFFLEPFNNRNERSFRHSFAIHLECWNISEFERLPSSSRLPRYKYEHYVQYMYRIW